MQHTLAVFLFIGTIFTAIAAEDFYANWHTDYDKAMAAAAENGQMVFAEFANTYNCPHCIRFRQQVLASDDFQDYTENHLVLLLVDHPTKDNISAELRQQNRRLFQKFNVRGTPTIVLLDSDGNELFRNVGYSGSDPERVVDMIKAVRENRFTPEKD